MGFHHLYGPNILGSKSSEHYFELGAMFIFSGLPTF